MFAKITMMMKTALLTTTAPIRLVLSHHSHLQQQQQQRRFAWGRKWKQKAPRRKPHRMKLRDLEEYEQPNKHTSGSNLQKLSNDDCSVSHTIIIRMSLSHHITVARASCSAGSNWKILTHCIFYPTTLPTISTSTKPFFVII